MDSKITIGVTGGIGSGKSMVCRIIRTLGYPVFYSDTEAKKLYLSNQGVRDMVSNLFGNQAYNSGGLNRKFLAERIYEEPELKSQLEGIIHPAVRDEFARWSQEQTEQLVFNEAAILFETGGYKDYNYTILVISPEKLRMSRIMKRDRLEEEEVRKRFDSQWSDEKKKELATFLIQNDEKSLLIPQVLDVIEKIKQAENI
jgi:dephospho-CoA kinase